MKLSIAVLTRNEEKNIKKCLESLRWCDEILVIDDYSTDQTVKIARQLEARVFKRHLNNDFAAQRNFGLKKAKGEWILFVDADERVPSLLKEEILRCCEVLKRQGFYLKRRDWFGGRWLKHGETGNVKLLRLARKGAGRWERQVHEVWKIKGQAGELSNYLEHYPHQTITEFLNEVNFYSTLHARALLSEGIRPSFKRIVFNPLGKFLVSYVFRLGFLDGMSGMVVALMMSLHSFLASAKMFTQGKAPNDVS